MLVLEALDNMQGHVIEFLRPNFVLAFWRMLFHLTVLKEAQLADVLFAVEAKHDVLFVRKAFMSDRG